MIRSWATRIGLAGFVGRLWRPDVEDALKPVRKDVRQLLNQVEALEASLERTERLASRADRTAAQVKLTAVLNREQCHKAARVAELLDSTRVATHVRAAIESTPLVLEPYEHMVVEQLLPRDVYDTLIDAIPPEPFFDDHDPIKRNLRFPMDVGPTLTGAVWGFFDDAVTAEMIRPAVLDRFHGPLLRHYDSIFGPEFRALADAMPHRVNSGRLMLRRRGYHLDPHRDPKHSMLTCLVYFARPGDDEAFGTQIFSVTDDADADYKQTVLSRAGGPHVHAGQGRAVPAQQHARVSELARRSRGVDSRRRPQIARALLLPVLYRPGEGRAWRVDSAAARRASPHVAEQGEAGRYWSSLKLSDVSIRMVGVLTESSEATTKAQSVRPIATVNVAPTAVKP